MKKTLSNQEYDDLLSCVSIAIKNAPKDSPKFKKAIESLHKKLWMAPVKEHITMTFMERVENSMLKDMNTKKATKKRGVK